ncbi:MAG: hemolysin III family protein [Ginsengibacter sp.]
MRKSYFHFESETVNTITHALGILFGIIFIPLLIQRSFQHCAAPQIIGVLFYGVFFMSTFSLSTLYHALRKPRLKLKFRILDHISIYFFIAATYTCFVLHYMFNTKGIILLSLIWLFAVTGSFFKFFYVNRFALVSVISYVFMGLSFLGVRRSFFANMPHDVILFIYCGAGFYLLGIIFFLWRKWRHHHALWHLIVLAGSICHFKAVWLSVTKHPF